MLTSNMTNQSPGVYIYEEDVAGPIQGVSTSIAAIIGPASKGEINIPTLITNWTQYETIFGGFEILKTYSESYTPYAVKGFFENGGAILKFVRVEETASLSLQKSNESTPQIPDIKKDENEIATNTKKGDIAPKRAFPGADNFINAIATLEMEDDVTLLCIPDSKGDNSIQVKMIEHCEKKQNRFAILDTDGVDITDPNNAKVPRSERGFGAVYYPWIIVPVDSKAPSSDDTKTDTKADTKADIKKDIKTDIKPETKPDTVKIPPSGHIAGLFARTDAQKGVHKAPANEVLNGVLGVACKHTETVQGLLNEKSINVIRPFPGRGIVVWGARTIAPPEKSQWRYVNVRRLLLYIEESVKRASMFAVFEPNNVSLWATMKRQINGFLTDVWKNGALIGATPDIAFNIKIDDELNPPPQIKLGILNVQIKLYPTTPAEFIVFKIIQKPGGAEIEE